MNSDNQIEFGKLIGLSFTQNSERKIGALSDGSGLIFSEDIANNDISSYNLILEAIDNLISINTKYEYKTALKAILDDYSHNNVSYMLHENNEEAVIREISNKFDCSLPYAKKVYNQLKNRVNYRYVGLYSVNDDITNKVNALTPIFLTSYDILKSRIEYLLRRQYMLYNDFIEELRMRLYPFTQSEDEEEEDLISSLANYFNVKIYDAYEDFGNEDAEEAYSDAIELLKYEYFEELNENSKYPNPNYKPYSYELQSEYAMKNFINYKDALKYINSYNKSVLNIEAVDAVEEEFNRQEAIEHNKQRYEHPIEEKTFYDTSLKDEVRVGASSLATQWNSYFDTLLNGILSDNEEDNEYYILQRYAMELVADYGFLETSEVFLENGSINEYSKHLQELRQNLLIEFKDFDVESKNKKITQIIGIKKREWKLLYNTINNPEYQFLDNLSYLNCRTLKFD
ncbi:hypothetical protein KKB86_03425 [bacterium]|nr:hypothetical protein [bacterium]